MNHAYGALPGPLGKKSSLGVRVRGPGGHDGASRRTGSAKAKSMKRFPPARTLSPVLLSPHLNTADPDGILRKSSLSSGSPTRESGSRVRFSILTPEVNSKKTPLPSSNGLFTATSDLGGTRRSAPHAEESHNAAVAAAALAREYLSGTHSSDDARHRPTYASSPVYFDMRVLRTILSSIQDACGGGLNESEEMDRLACANGMRRAAPAQASSPRRTPWLQATLNSLTVDVMVHCLSFCDLRSLLVVAQVNRRLHILAQTNYLWMPHAIARRIVVRNPARAQEEIKQELERRRLDRNSEVRRCETEYEALEERMIARVRATRAQNIDVDGTLAAHDPDAVLHGDVRTGARCSEAGRAELLESLKEAVKEMEKLQVDTQAQMQAQESILHSQKEELAAMQRLLSGHAGEVGCEAAGAGVEGTASLADMAMFERRMTRLVLSGRGTVVATLGNDVSAATASKESPLDTKELPVTLRRGITDFGALELLCMEDKMDASFMPPIRRRWAAFKRFFPLNEDYYTARAILSSGSGGPISKRGEIIVHRVSGLVRRIQAMKDTEVMDVVL